MRHLIIPLLAVVLAAIAPLSASAHVLKTDGSIGAVLHILPDDNPTSGVSTRYELAFQDESGKFLLTDCDCMARISEGDKVVSSVPLTASSTNVSGNYVTFPKPDVYTLAITGTPKQAGEFEPFTIRYTVRASGSGASTASSFPPLLWIGIGMLLGLLLLVALAVDYTGTNVNRNTS